MAVKKNSDTMSTLPLSEMTVCVSVAVAMICLLLEAAMDG